MTHPNVHFCDSFSENDTIDILKNKLPNTNNNKFLKNKLPNGYDLLFGGNNSFFALFYAPWCGWSQKMIPVWEKFKKEINNNDNHSNNIFIKEFSSTEHPDLMKKFNITGFPTIKLITPTKIIDYEGEREINSMIKFIKKYI